MKRNLITVRTTSQRLKKCINNSRVYSSRRNNIVRPPRNTVIYICIYRVDEKYGRAESSYFLKSIRSQITFFILEKEKNTI